LAETRQPRSELADRIHRAATLPARFVLALFVARANVDRIAGTVVVIAAALIGLVARAALVGPVA
jgi:hypothetical protein